MIGFEKVALLGAMFFVACASQTSTVEPTPPRHVQAPRRTDPREVRRQFCGDGSATEKRTSYSELLCGDYLAQHHELPQATVRWRHAIELATDRSEQCDAIGRIKDQALSPDEALAGVSQTVQENCRDRDERERHRAAMRARRADCLAQCRSGESTCNSIFAAKPNLISVLSNHCEDDRKNCEATCQGVR